MSPAAGTALWALPLLIARLWRPRRALTPGAWILLIAFGILGALALRFGLYAHTHEPAGFGFWKPTVLYWTLAAVMIIVPLLGWGYPVRALIGVYFALTRREWRWINYGFAGVYAVLGSVNLLVAYKASYDDWVGFKFSCMMNLLIIVVFRLNFVWLPILAEVAIHLYRRTVAAYRYLSNLV